MKLNNLPNDIILNIIQKTFSKPNVKSTRFLNYN